ncbi:ATP-binding protein [Siphonobacter sp. SORGH_AS_0500]|uniref:hybrid sensor histidine kinase/response regulator transcription factor n=2 Tax=Siphonobacter sp. SORGH_AS_0500 TaxID=1864824 RepID=UPI002862B198|nr:ATP-binding protein [Siphonobacter sp. SORGH_AS_0500]MDR6196880.1 signal transduction histidine kinase/CheY-like chemotaxis protein/ligand-binding sensor domain-containing protein [Siphonobacter sp. SORGH_AS_0500]
MSFLTQSFRQWLRLILLIFIPYLGSAQELSKINRPKRVITPRDGLPQAFVSGLVQDRTGFVWAATRNGLARYDGTHFKVFQHDKNDSTSLHSNVLSYLIPDVHNKIWIQYESTALDVFDPETEQVTHVSQEPLFRKNPHYFISQGLLVDHNSNVWGIELQNGLYYYDRQHQKVTHFTRHSHHLPSDSIRGIMEDSRHRVWVISMKGLGFINPTTGRYTPVSLPFPLDFGTSPAILTDMISMIERRNGELMFSDARKLIFLNPERNTFRQVPFLKDQNQSIRWIRTGPNGHQYWEIQGSVYEYSDRRGIRHVGESALEDLREACSFLVDRSGLIWLGTNAAGIHQIDLDAPYFHVFENKDSFHEDLFRKEFGLSLAQTFGWPKNEPEFQLSSYTLRSQYDAQKRLWIALWKNIGYWDEQQRRMVLLPSPPGLRTTNFLYEGIRGLSFDPQGQLWIMGNDGYLASFDALTRQWTTQLSASVLQDLSFAKKDHRPITPVDLYVDAQTIWLTTAFDGLIAIDRKSHRIEFITREKNPQVIPTNQLIGIVKDPSDPDLLWIGSYDGLICFQKSTKTSKIYTVAQGLPDNTIYSILPDQAGNLWLATNKGLCQFHPKTHQIRIFQASDGLPGEEFNRFHFLRLPDGRLAFGGIEGWTLFMPTRSFVDWYQPRSALTSININNIPIAQTPFAQAVSGLKALTLPYDQNSLTFDFSGLQYNQPHKLKYRYQLLGYDEEWNYTGHASLAHYTKLPPGNYVLQINATNTTGQWSPHIYQLTLTIEPPFYRTWWAYGLYLLLGGGLLWAFIQYRINQDRYKQAISLKEKEAAQLRLLDELKTRFFSNITHEFRTPLTLILTPAERLRQEVELPHQQRWIDSIERNAHQLLRLINQLMDLAKLESGLMQLSLVRGHLSEVITNLTASFQMEAERKGIQFKTQLHGPSQEYWFDIDKLERITYNLLSNALKFSKSGDQVRLVISQTPPTEIQLPEFWKSLSGGVYLSVQDSAIGIAPEALPHIFDRFYQVDESHYRQGTGIGLSLVKELVDIQQGHIHVESKLNIGTTFVIWLPYQQAVTEVIPTVKIEKEEDFQMPLLLVVEDNAELAEFITDSLSQSYRVSWAANGSEGLKQALALGPDLIISDVMMPIMTGLELCQALKKDEQTSHIPIILLTAKSGYQNRIEGLNYGANAYITKPFHIQELQLQVRNLLDQQRMIQQYALQALTEPNAQPSTVEDPFLTRCYTLLEERLDDSSLGVEEFAQLIGMSRVSLHRKIKALTGLPISEVIRNYRLKRAIVFLEEGYNSSQTAYRVGFESPAYFTKCFKDLYQITPSEYLKQASGSSQ